MLLICGIENEIEGEMEISKKVFEYVYWIENDMFYISCLRFVMNLGYIFF